MTKLGRISNGALNALQRNPKDQTEVNTSSRRVARQVLIYRESADKYAKPRYTFGNGAIPTGNSRPSKPDMAFGAFLGYTIKLDQLETDSQKYRVAVKEQLKRDIAKVQPYIVKKIQDNGLAGYSFYFYLLPFNDAPNERRSIIQELVSGGGI